VRILDGDTTVVAILHIDEIDVLPAVAVVVRDADARPKLFEVNGNALVPLEVHKFDSGGLSNIDQLDGRGCFALRRIERDRRDQENGEQASKGL
jgi:hypothetical protein